jgi:hypothetical protein
MPPTRSIRAQYAGRTARGERFAVSAWHCGGYFLPLLIKEGLTFSGRFAEAAVFG